MSKLIAPKLTTSARLKKIPSRLLQISAEQKNFSTRLAYACTRKTGLAVHPAKNMAGKEQAPAGSVPAGALLLASPPDPPLK
jgi:hypothetical protein